MPPGGLGGHDAPQTPSERKEAVPSPAEAENGTASFRSKPVRSTSIEVGAVAGML